MSILDTDLLNVVVEYYIVRMGTKSVTVDSFYRFYGFENQRFTSDLTEFINTYDADISINAFIDISNAHVKSGLGPAMYMFLKCISPKSLFINSIALKLTDKIRIQMNMTADSKSTIKPFVYSYLYEHPTIESPVQQSLFKLLKNNNITDSDWKYLIQLAANGLTKEDVKYLDTLNKL